MLASSTGIPIGHIMCVNSRWVVFDIDRTCSMTAQERKDFRRVQKSRELWQKRAVRRGGQSREAWRERALAAEHRIEELEIETHQLKNAVPPAQAPSAIDNRHFFELFLSAYRL